MDMTSGIKRVVYMQTVLCGAEYLGYSLAPGASEAVIRTVKGREWSDMCKLVYSDKG
jgi:hypothetical protein